MQQRSTILLVLAAAGLGLLLATGIAVGDDIHLKKGKLKGVIVRRENGRALVNPYNSRNEHMTWGLESVDEKEIRKVEPDATPEWRYLESLLETIPTGKDGGADNHLSMAARAAELGLGERELFHLREALIAGADGSRAAGKLSTAEIERLRRADPRANPDLRAALDAYYAEQDGKERRAAADRIAHDFGLDWGFERLERTRRSRALATGRHDDVAVRLRSKEEKGVYTIVVPPDYDPEHCWPLVLGLHGGGPDGKDGKDVVGSGSSAMNFYATGAARYGYIVVCPTARQAPWSAPVNDSFVRTVLEEVELAYNVDLNRVYLTGHSMGGFGSWHFGQRYPQLFAVVAPMAGGGFRSTSPFEKSLTPVYIHHGANDAVVGVAGDRQAAEAFRRIDWDFIYTELPDSGHGFPPEIAEEMWRIFRVRRLAVAPKRADKGKFAIDLTELSSFSAAWSKDEETYWGKPGEELPQDRKSLLERLRLGGACGREAADLLIAQEDPKSLLAVLGKLVVTEKEGLDVRREAARLLGLTKLPEATKPLLAALKKPEPDLVPALAAALTEVADESVVKGLGRTIAALVEDFDSRLSGQSMRYSDWARSLGALEAMARLCQVLGPADAAKSLEAAAKHALLEDWEVPSSDRAGLDPARPLGSCAAAFVKALSRCEGAGETLAALKNKHGALAPVREALEGP
ncbi:MAG: dienelactone hydrolase family protein [Planctomycetes bacterium]|nr:dienelactone hydrolase family protein [Planctomycetota bacterium]